MAFTAASVMKRANTILQDVGAVRWTAPELRDWLNEAQRAIVLAKPNALSGSVTLTLASGTKQTIPAQYTVLSRVVRNVGNGNRAVRTMARREILDSQIPGWHDTATLPFAASVQYVWQDPMSPREFYVVPGNDGNGEVEALVGRNPTDIPLAPGGGLDIDDYTTTSEFEDIYQGILLDFVLFRAFSKDGDAPDAAAQAGSHLTLATNALTALGASQTAASLAMQYMTAAAAG
ncbi:hypothetical protein PAF17_16035 [Paracoccus sp. Z330]|uniref:Phage tail protein n=1 Tax=Paracoccus onchidii TaxID=3017813 RepID=A0ABT4ZI15_9RHOB|nr:DUF6682 family protein [Paracoccus onchidii]MDB6179002.1 hypothetical protein [Paracoccus onchidii]